MPLNVEKYRPYLDDFDMSEEQKTEFIKAMWTIMQSFADHAFEQRSVNHRISQAKSYKNCCGTPEMVKYSHQVKVKAVNDNRRHNITPKRKKMS